jgi:hypothetical protein
MCVARGRLVRSSPQRPCDDVGGRDTALGEPNGDAPNLLYGPADQRRGAVRILFGGVTPFAWWRITAIMANASMTSDTWRCFYTRKGFRCGRGRVRSWSSRSFPRSPNGGLQLARARRSRSRPGYLSCEERQFAVRDMSSNQQAACPHPCASFTVIGSLVCRRVRDRPGRAVWLPSPHCLPTGDARRRDRDSLQSRLQCRKRRASLQEPK